MKELMISLQLRVRSVDEIRERFIKNNIQLFRDITVSEYECNGEIIFQKEFLVQDLNGYLLRFYSE
ncbi:MAG: hypothetical protein ACRDCW_03415 [Sarcina sp.]